jgi:hypothetical protein
MANRLAVMANSPADYERLRLSPTSIAAWEDGARTDGSAGTYEWWYFDAHLADGAKLVVSFMDKGDIADPKGPLSPVLRLNLDLPDGRHFEKLVHHRPDEWSAATDHADVRLGNNRFSGDRALEFAWLPAVPQGAVTAKYSIGGEQHETTGVGYHDHNWGNVGLLKVVHDWYWARGQAGPYSVIASYITAAKRYGFESIPIFMLARDNVLVGDDPAKVTFAREGVYTDPKTGKPVATTTRYTYRDAEDRYVVAFTRTHDLSVDRMIDTVKGVKRIAAKLAHFDGAYLRFVGDIEISRYRSDELVESHKEDAIWELMYFGHAR